MVILKGIRCFMCQFQEIHSIAQPSSSYMSTDIAESLLEVWGDTGRKGVPATSGSWWIITGTLQASGTWWEQGGWLHAKG